MNDALKLAQVVISKASLDVMPQEVFWLVEELEKPLPNFAVIAGHIGRNPQLLADFLKTTNRILQSNASIKDARTAVNMMGLDEIRNLFMSVSSRYVFGDHYFGRQLFDQSIRVGIAAAELSYWVYEVSRSEAYFAGLIQNVGVSSMERVFSEAYQKIYEKQQAHPFSAYEQELELFKCSHIHVGLLLAKKWGVEPDIYKSIYMHHDPAFVEKTAQHPKVRMLTALTMLANYVVMEYLDETYITQELKTSREIGLAALAIPENAMTAARAAVAKWGGSGLTLGSH